MPVISKFDYDNFYDIFFKGEPNSMKKPFILLLCAFLAFSIVSCNGIDKSEETDGTEETTELQYTFISNEEKSTWRSHLTAILSKKACCKQKNPEDRSLPDFRFCSIYRLCFTRSRSSARLASFHLSMVPTR